MSGGRSYAVILTKGFVICNYVWMYVYHYKRQGKAGIWVTKISVSLVWSLRLKRIIVVWRSQLQRSVR